MYHNPSYINYNPPCPDIELYDITVQLPCPSPTRGLDENLLTGYLSDQAITLIPPYNYFIINP